MSLNPRAVAALLTSSALLLATAQITPALAAGADGTIFGAPVLPSDSPLLVKPAEPKVVADTGFLPNRAKPAAQAGDAAAVSAEPNLSALRFYASQNDLARVAAEIRLLRAKFPGWEPPADLFTEERSGEAEQPLWDLFAKHDLQGLQAAIAERQRQTPGWKPSSDLSNKLSQALAYDQMVQASEAKDYGTVLDLASSNRGLLTCGNVDAIWHSAEALIATGDQPHAIEAYRYVLANCSNPKERLATVQKASELLTTPGALDDLLAMGRRRPDGTNEFADLRFDAMRRRIGEALAAKQTAPQADVDALAAHAHQGNAAKDAELLGWYARSRQNYAEAEAWFREALRAGATPKAAEGLVLALRDGGKRADAIAAARQYAMLGDGNRKLMVEVLVTALDGTPPLPSEAVAELATGLDAVKDADAAQAFGWYRFKAKAAADAQDWFKKSLEWQPNEAAAVGLMVTAKQLKQGELYAATVSRYSPTYPKVAELASVMKASERARPTRVASRHRGGGGGAKGDGWDQNATAIVDTFQNGHVDQALAMMDARRAGHREPKGLSVVRGWALYKKGDWEGARQVFNELDTKGMHDEAGKGLKQIELGYTNPRFR